MTKGGARNRSGPQPDPTSGRSESRGLSFSALPREGYTGVVPRCPLPAATARERAMWKLVWSYPQGAAWAAEPWRQLAVSQYVRLAVRAEDAEAPASLIASLHRFADQIGLTPAGLKENGWAISQDEVREKRQTRQAPADAPKPTRRLRAVSNE